MASSESEDDQIFVEASQKFETEYAEQYVAEYAEQYVKDRRKYEHMDEDDFGIDKLLQSQPQPQRFGPDKLLQSQPQPQRFGPAVTEEELLKKIHNAVPKTTRRSTEWAVNLWEEWLMHRQSTSSEAPPSSLDVMNNEELNRWLARFVVEVHTQKGEQYNGGSLYGLCAGIQRYIREKRVESNRESMDIYKDPKLAHFRCVFDSVLKELHQQGVGVVKKQAGVISDEIEERLWEEKFLGDDSPQQLLDTLVYCLGLNLALRSGREHRSLKPGMFCFVQPPDGRPPYLQYTEWGSKNHGGGLNDRKVGNKLVKIFSNEQCPERCVVRLYQKYLSLRPAAPSDALYLQPLCQPRANCWYKSKPVGHNPLSLTVKKLTGKLGLEGYYTNHSLRRTCATRLYRKGVEEQQIMSITGHRSKDGVRTYKETSVDQEEKLSKIMQCGVTGVEAQDDKLHALQPTKKKLRTVDNDPTFNFTNCTVTFNN